MCLGHGRICAIEAVHDELAKEGEADFSQAVNFLDLMLIGQKYFSGGYLAVQVDVLANFQ